jgi:hypothetical protein
MVPARRAVGRGRARHAAPTLPPLPSSVSQPPLSRPPTGDANGDGDARSRGLHLIRVESDAEPLRARSPPRAGSGEVQTTINVGEWGEGWVG